MRRNQHILSLLLMVALAFGLTACEESRPDWVMAEEEMVPIIKDLHLAYAGVDVTIRNPKNRPGRYQEMNELVIKKHGVDRHNFYDSYEYYQSQPALMDSIYQHVIEELNAELQPKQAATPANPEGRPPKSR